MRYMQRPSHSFQFYHPNNFGEEQKIQTFFDMSETTHPTTHNITPENINSALYQMIVRSAQKKYIYLSLGFSSEFH
jgi:hypothetical protein